jgi:dTDP-4-amino-4,6-dideoxygalactose transaminase
MEKLALFGGEPVMKSPFPLWPQYDEKEKAALTKVLESRVWWRTPGTETLQFERDFAAYHEAKHGIAVTNGTAALEVALAALGVGPGDEVILPDFTFVATASAVLFTGALPVFVDVTPDTFCIDPDLVEKAITKQTKAIIGVHIGGHPADLDRLLDIAQKYDLKLVEDSAHAHGSEWKGRKVGAIGDIGTFSFQSSKLMTAGEGGIVITNNDKLERKARSIHDCGRLPGEWFYSHFMYGSNYRLSEWQGAILSQQLSRLDEQAAIRTRNAAYLDDALSKIDGVIPQKQDKRCTRNGHYAYIFRIKTKAFADIAINRFIEAFNAEGVPTQASYPPVHALDVFKNNKYRQRLCGKQRKAKHEYLKAKYPNTEKAAWETVWLPQYVLLGSMEDMRQIVSAVEKIQKMAKELR